MFPDYSFHKDRVSLISFDLPKEFEESWKIRLGLRSKVGRPAFEHFGARHGRYLFGISDFHMVFRFRNKLACNIDEYLLKGCCCIRLRREGLKSEELGIKQVTSSEEHKHEDVSICRKVDILIY